MKNDRIWLLANWKMNGSVETVSHFAQGLEALLQNAPATLTTIFCPPSLYISGARAAASRLSIGAQNCHAKEKGAFTGEISASMLKEIGCDYVILGHSERRQMGETDAEIEAKTQTAIAAGLAPVICIGETERDYLAGRTNEILKTQLGWISALAPESYLIAYEPVWAIGTGKTPASAEIEAVHAFIKSVLGRNAAVLYGGSVNSGNAREILQIPGVSGALIGSASLNLSVMEEIIAASRG